jgi:membrane protein YdbS with pleckstrin-like domain
MSQSDATRTFATKMITFFVGFLVMLTAVIYQIESRVSGSHVGVKGAFMRAAIVMLLAAPFFYRYYKERWRAPSVSGLG